MGILANGTIYSVRERRAFGKVSFDENPHHSQPSGPVTVKVLPENTQRIKECYEESSSITSLEELRKYPRDIAKKLVHHFGVRATLSDNTERTIRGWKFTVSCPHILLPLYSAGGSVEGFQLRLYCKKGPRFRFVKAPGMLNTPPFSVYTPENGERNTVLVTEGPLKAMLASYFMHIPTISLQGVGLLSRYKEIARLAQQIGASRVVFAVDQDVYEERHVDALRGLLTAVREVFFGGFLVNVAAWREGKGIDDALLSGQSIYPLTITNWKKTLPKEVKSQFKNVLPQMDRRKRRNIIIRNEDISSLCPPILVPSAIDGDAEMLSLRRKHLVFPTMEETVQAALKAAAPGKTVVAEIPTGEGKTFFLGQVLSGKFPLPDSWQVFSQIVYVSNPVYTTNSSDLSSLPLSRGRSEYGYAETASGTIEAREGQIPTFRYLPNCPFAETLKRVQEAGNIQLAAKICNGACPFREKCRYHQERKSASDAPIRRESWITVQAAAHTLYLVDEEVAAQRFIPNTFSSDQLTLLLQNLHLVQTERLQLAPSNMQESLVNAFALLRELLSALLQIDQSFRQGNRQLFLGNTEIKAALHQTLRKAGLQHATFPPVTLAISSFRPEQVAFRGVSEEDVENFSQATTNATAWFAFQEKFHPVLDLDLPATTTYSGMCDTLKAVLEPRTHVYYRASSGEFTVMQENPVYRLLLTREMETDVSRTTGTVLFDATPVQSLLSASERTLFFSMTNRARENVVIYQIIDFPGYFKSTPIEKKRKMLQEVLEIARKLRDEEELIDEKIGVVVRKDDLQDVALQNLLSEDDVVAGYAFRHDRGSNFFHQHDVGLLVILGDAIKNPHAQRAELVALSETPENSWSMWDERELEETVPVFRRLNEEYTLLREEPKVPLSRTKKRLEELAAVSQAIGRLRANRKEERKLLVVYTGKVPLHALHSEYPNVHIRHMSEFQQTTTKTPNTSDWLPKPLLPLELLEKRIIELYNEIFQQGLNYYQAAQKIVGDHPDLFLEPLQAVDWVESFLEEVFGPHWEIPLTFLGRDWRTLNACERARVVLKIFVTLQNAAKLVDVQHALAGISSSTLRSAHKILQAAHFNLPEALESILGGNRERGGRGFFMEENEERGVCYVPNKFECS